jgi:hypothetical protein
MGWGAMQSPAVTVEDQRKVPPAYERALPIRANTGRERVPKARARLTAVRDDDLSVRAAVMRQP